MANSTEKSPSKEEVYAAMSVQELWNKLREQERNEVGLSQKLHNNPEPHPRKKKWDEALNCLRTVAMPRVRRILISKLNGKEH